VADFDLEICYKPGKQQKIADYLSRWRPCKVDSKRECVQCRPKTDTGATVTRRKRKLSPTVGGLDSESALSDRECCQTDAADDARGVINCCGDDCCCERGSMPGTDLNGTARQTVSDPDRSSGDAASACNCRLDGPTARSGGTGDESTDRRLSSGPAVALHSHGRTEDMPTDHLQAASAEQRNTDCGLKMSAVSFDRANDGLIAPVNSRRVMTRAQQQLRPNTDGQSQQLRTPNNAMKLPDVSLGSRCTREEIARLQDEDAALREMRSRLSAGGVADSASGWSDPDLMCYLRQLDSLVNRDGVVYRKFVDATGAVQYYQLLLPPSMRVACLD
jgi:hypothetical protein